MKFDGTNWVNVGLPGFSAGAIYYPCLVFSPSGQPYLAFRDNGTLFGKASVMKYDLNTTGINDSQYSGLTIYPNPTSDKLNIDLKRSNANKTSLEILNTVGKLMTEIKSFKENINLDIKNFPSGIYIVKLQNNSSIYTKVFVKN